MVIRSLLLEYSFVDNNNNNNNNNNKFKISIALFPDVIKSALQIFPIKLNTILNRKMKI